MTTLKLAIIQFPRRLDDLKSNTELMAGYVARLAADTTDTDVVLLPEGWLGPKLIPLTQYEEIMDQVFSRLKPLNCLLVSGAQYVIVDDQVFCRGLVLSQHLPKPIPFDKLFPSQAVGERSFVAPGTELPVFKHKGVSLGVALCVDLFYPEVVRNLALREVSLVLNPANIPSSRMALWQGLGVARACENTVFVAMANNTETSYADGRKIMGESFVAYPDGQKLVNFGRESGIFYLTLDLQLINRVRERWPYLEDVRTRTLTLDGRCAFRSLANQIKN